MTHEHWPLVDLMYLAGQMTGWQRRPRTWCEEMAKTLGRTPGAVDLKQLNLLAAYGVPGYEWSHCTPRDRAVAALFKADPAGAEVLAAIAGVVVLDRAA